jgi:hypothetical protein
MKEGQALRVNLLSGSGGFHGINGNLLLVAAQTLEADDAVHQGEQGVILALANVSGRDGCGCRAGEPGMLPQGRLTVGTLRSETLGLAVAAVYGWKPIPFYARTAEDSISSWCFPPFLYGKMNVPWIGFRKIGQSLSERSDSTCASWNRPSSREAGR